MKKPKKCVICGMEFVPKLKTAVACSLPCKKKRQRTLIKQWHEDHSMTQYWREYKRRERGSTRYNKPRAA